MRPIATIDGVTFMSAAKEQPQDPVFEERCPYHGKAPTILVHSANDRIGANGVYCTLCAVKLSIANGGYKYSDEYHKAVVAQVEAFRSGGVA